MLGFDKNGKAMAKKIGGLEVTEIIGVCDRTMRRMREGCEKFGYCRVNGPAARETSTHRVPMETAEEGLRSPGGTSCSTAVRLSFASSTRRSAGTPNG
jgi:hypothetical protein